MEVTQTEYMPHGLLVSMMGPLNDVGVSIANRGNIDPDVVAQVLCSMSYKDWNSYVAALPSQDYFRRPMERSLRGDCCRMLYSLSRRSDGKKWRDVCDLIFQTATAACAFFDAATQLGKIPSEDDLYQAWLVLYSDQVEDIKSKLRSVLLEYSWRSAAATSAEVDGAVMWGLDYRIKRFFSGFIREHHLRPGMLYYAAQSGLPGVLRSYIHPVLDCQAQTDTLFVYECEGTQTVIGLRVTTDTTNAMDTNERKEVAMAHSSASWMSLLVPVAIDSTQPGVCVASSQRTIEATDMLLESIAQRALIHG